MTTGRINQVTTVTAPGQRVARTREAGSRRSRRRSPSLFATRSLSLFSPCKPSGNQSGRGRPGSGARRGRRSSVDPPGSRLTPIYDQTAARTAGNDATSSKPDTLRHERRDHAHRPRRKRTCTSGRDGRAVTPAHTDWRHPGRATGTQTSGSGFSLRSGSTPHSSQNTLLRLTVITVWEKTCTFHSAFLVKTCQKRVSRSRGKSTHQFWTLSFDRVPNPVQDLMMWLTCHHRLLPLI